MKGSLRTCLLFFTGGNMRDSNGKRKYSCSTRFSCLYDGEVTWFPRDIASEDVACESDVPSVLNCFIDLRLRAQIATNTMIPISAGIAATIANMCKATISTFSEEGVVL